MADAMLAGWGEPITRRKGITARGYGESGDRRSSFWPMSAEHYRTVALRFRKRAADTSDLQLRQAIRYVAATYEAPKAKARGRGPFARPGQPALRPVQGEPASAPDTLGLGCLPCTSARQGGPQRLIEGPGFSVLARTGNRGRHSASKGAVQLLWTFVRVLLQRRRGAGADNAPRNAPARRSDLCAGIM